MIVGLFIGRNAAALAANFGANFWQGVKALHPIQVGAGGPLVLVSTLTILAVAQVGSLFSADAWNNVTFTAGEVINPKRNLPLSLTLGTGVVIALYIACNVIYLSVLPLHGSPDGVLSSHRYSARHRRSGRDCCAHADVRQHRRLSDGRGHYHFEFRLQ